jgi:hypothetical protein
MTGPRVPSARAPIPPRTDGTRAESVLSTWAATADPAVTDQLSTCIAELTTLVVGHLDDEERNAVPIIEEHLTHDEWQAGVKLGASFLNTHPRLGIVLGGLVLDYASPDERTAEVPVRRALSATVVVEALERSDDGGVSPATLWLA